MSDSPIIHLRHLIVLGIILIAATVLRWHKIGSASLWIDEFLSVEVSAGHGYEDRDLPRDAVVASPPDLMDFRAPGTWTETLESFQRTTHPPLYFCLLRLWREFWHSDNDTVIRSMSVVFSVLALLLAFDAVRLLSGIRAALWASGLLAMAVPQIELAQEARGYTLLILLMLGCCAAIARIEKLGTTRRRQIALFLCAAAMLLTHYLGFALIVALVLYCIIRLIGETRRTTLFSLSMAIAFVLCAWGPVMILQSHEASRHLAWLVEPHTDHFWTAISRLATLPERFFLNNEQHVSLLSCLGVALFFLPIALLRKSPGLLLWAMLLWVGTAVLVIGDLKYATSSLAFSRYTLPAATAGTVLAAIITSSLPGRARYFAPSVLAVACMLSLPGSYVRNKPDWRELAEYLDRDTRPGETLVFYPAKNLDWYAPILYIGLSRYDTDMEHRRIVILSHPPDRSLIENLSTSGPIEVISGSLDANQILPGCRIRSDEYFPNVAQCYQVELTPQTPNRSVSIQPTAQALARGSS